MSSSVIVLTGPPGAGKSTIALELARHYPRAVHLHTDDFWHYIVAGAIPPYEPESDAQNQTVVEVISGAAYRYALGGFTTVVDGIVGPWMLDHYRAWVQQFPEISLHYVVLRPTRDVTLSRARQRTDFNALVEQGPILQMWDQFKDLGAFERHVLDTSDEDQRASLQRVSDAISSGHFVLSPRT